MIQLAIICPCYNEAKYLSGFLHSLSEQTIFSSPDYKVSVYVADGNSDDGSPSILEAYCNEKSNWHIVSNPQRFVSYGLNKCIRNAISEGAQYIVRMDMHATYPCDYVVSLIQKTILLESAGVAVGNYGGLVRTLPGDHSLKARMISSVLSSRFGVGASLFRTGATKVTEVDTVPFGCFPVNVLNQTGYFDTDLIRNQDDELNGRITKMGFKIFLDPEISMEYYARSGLKKLFLMFFQYGYFKPLVNLKLGKPATKRQFVPPVFVVTLLLAFVLAAFSFLPLISLILAYILFCVLFVATCTADISSNFLLKLIWAVVVLFTTHFSYGWGYLRGMAHWTLRAKKHLV